MNQLVNRLSTLLLLLLYILPLTYLMADSFGFVLDRWAPLWLAAVCLSVWITADFRRGLFIGLPLSALILYAAYKTYDGQLALQLSDFFDRVTGSYYERFYSPGSRFVYSTLSENQTLILLFVAFLLGSYLSTGLISRNGRIFFSLIGTLPPFAFSIVTNGDPSPAAVLCLTLFWVLLLVGGVRFDPDSHQGRAVFAAALPVLLLLGLILVWKPPSEYQASKRDFSVSSTFDGFARAVRKLMGVSDSVLLAPIEERVPVAGASPGAAVYGFGSSLDGSMDLSEGYDYTGLGSTALTVTSPEGGYVYLRGRSFGEYAGSSWLQAEDQEVPSSLPFAAQAARLYGAEERRMEIALEVRGDVLYLPYYSPLTGGTDSFVPLSGQSDYSASYYSGGQGFLSLPPEYAQAELSYRSYAHDVYTRLPEDTKSALLALANQAGLSAGSPEIVSQVASYVQQAGVYDLSTESYPSDDYAVYFLTQAKRGYCIHFATAAAAMYRALGIPARVTEGFLYISSPNEPVEVLGSDAHAWVEVYSDGVGWLPVEVTGRSGLLPEGPGEDAPQPTPEPSQEPEAAPSQSPESGSPPASPSPALSGGGEPAGPSVGLVSPEQPSPAVTEAPPAGNIQFPWQVFAAAGALVLLASLLPLRRLVLLELTRRRLRQRDSKKAAVAIWRQAVRVSAYGAPVPGAIRLCAEKASFSLHEISPAELTACRVLLASMTKDTWQELRGFRKFSFKYLKCLI